MGPVRLGRYELERLLGRGGMGEVYLSRLAAPAGIEKPVVVKTIAANLLRDDRVVQLFVEEARIGLSLSHPNIVPMFDFGVDDGRPYLVMELVRGADLARLLRMGALPPAASVRVAADVCDALSYLHGQRSRDGRPLVHGDLSPRNVLVSDDGAVRLADFGAARRTGVAGGNRAGTQRYMSPEQARGEPIDERSDLYSLGLLLAECLFGSHRERVEPADGELGELLASLTDADRDRRPESAAVVRDALESIARTPSGSPRVMLADLVCKVGAEPEIAPSGSSSTPTRTATDGRSGAQPSRWPAIAAAALGVLLLSPPEERIPTAPSSPIHRPHRAVPREPAPATALAPTAPPSARAATAAVVRGSQAIRDRPRPGPGARLDVTASPWASVEIDGRGYGETPLAGLSLTAGVHQIRFRNSALSSDRMLEVQVGDGEQLLATADLEDSSQSALRIARRWSAAR